MSDQKTLDYNAFSEERNTLIRAVLIYATTYSRLIGDATKFGVIPTQENIHQQYIVLSALKNVYQAAIVYAKKHKLKPNDIIEESLKFRNQDDIILSSNDIFSDISNAVNDSNSPMKAINDLLNNLNKQGNQDDNETH